ncbi:MAG: HAD-IA family hydrolase, partial [Candidatus Thermoplasmatota archaeon]|nr:HAD-IA family hydrolase [Candidatus Thermoplasmatota archaeon]
LYRDIQYSTFMQDTTVFPGARETLSAWKAQGRKLAVFTMRRNENARTVLSAFDMLDYFDAIVGYEDAPQPKPSPEHVIHAASLLLAEPEDSYVVGDNPEDMRSGRGAGATTLGVLWGLGLKETLMDAGAHDTVEDWKALARKIVD